MSNPNPNPTPYTTICVSGSFDPVHVGHIRMIQDAAKYGRVIVILNSDEWLYRKKGFVFMPYKEREEILEAFKAVDRVVPALDMDETVCASLEQIRPDYFANGGDRGPTNTPETLLCNKLGIQTLWNIGGNKVQSSSDLVMHSASF